MLEAYEITRSFPKSSLGCDPGFKNPFSSIMQYDKCITRNYVLKQPNINCNVAVTKFLQSHRSVHRKILNGDLKVNFRKEIFKVAPVSSSIDKVIWTDTIYEKWRLEIWNYELHWNFWLWNSKENKIISKILDIWLQRTRYDVMIHSSLSLQTLRYGDICGPRWVKVHILNRRSREQSVACRVDFNPRKVVSNTPYFKYVTT